MSGHRRRPPEIIHKRELEDDLHKMMDLACNHRSRVRVGTPHYRALALLSSTIAETYRAVFGDTPPPPWARPNTPPVYSNK